MSRYDDERWAQFDQPTLLDDCEPAWDDPWPDDPPPRPVRDWVDQIAGRLREQHRALVDEATDDYGRVMDSLPDGYGRKEFALAAAKYATRPALFLIHDEKDAAVDAWAWKQLKPRADKPFKADEEG